MIDPLMPAIGLSLEMRETPMPFDGLPNSQDMKTTNANNSKTEGLLFIFNGNADRTAFLLKLSENNADVPCKFVGHACVWLGPEQSGRASAVATALGLRFEVLSEPWPDHKQDASPEPSFEKLVNSWDDIMRYVSRGSGPRPF